MDSKKSLESILSCDIGSSNFNLRTHDADEREREMTSNLSGAFLG